MIAKNSSVHNSTLHIFNTEKFKQKYFQCLVFYGNAVNIYRVLDVKICRVGLYSFPGLQLLKPVPTFTRVLFTQTHGHVVTGPYTLKYIFSRHWFPNV